MPVTRIVCPSCGHEMPANALEAAGAVATLCQSCEEYVYVATNERGRVIDIYVGEDDGRVGAGHGAVYYGDEEEEEDYDEGDGRGRRATYIPLLLILVGLIFLAWIASTLYCTRRPVPQIVINTPTPEEIATPSPTPAPTRPPVIVLDSANGVTFEIDKASLTEESKIALLNLAESLKDAPKTTTFEIRGHTDNQGGEAHNKQLSYQRAETVRQFLIKQGIPAAQLRAKGYGATVPKGSNETEEGRRLNRRIEVVEIKAAPVKQGQGQGQKPGEGNKTP